jgi:polyhydroxyalkanoate synthesis repressor PhaR
VDGIVDSLGLEASRIIKRYANRKLYDTRESRYVTLQHIADFVRSGEDVQIIDNKSKEDVTSVTLAQIIYEEEKSAEGDRSSVRSLRHFIQDGRERLLSSFLEGPMGKLVPRPDAKDAKDAAKPAADDGSPAEPPVVDASPMAADATREALRSLVNAPKEALDELQRLADDGVRAIVSGALTHVQQLQGEVRRLQGRIDELETRLGVLAKRTPRPTEEPLAPEPTAADPDPNVS